MKIEKGGVSVRVHSLGADATPTGTLTIEDETGHVLARAPIPVLQAPSDLLPKTADVHVALAQPLAGARLSVRVRLEGATKEITDLNNSVPFTP